MCSPVKKMRPSAHGVKKNTEVKQCCAQIFKTRRTMEANVASFPSSAQQNKEQAAQNRKQ